MAPCSRQRRSGEWPPSRLWSMLVRTPLPVKRAAPDSLSGGSRPGGLRRARMRYGTRLSNRGGFPMVERSAPYAGIMPAVVEHNGVLHFAGVVADRSEEHTSELQSLMRNTYAGFLLEKKQYSTHLH